MEKNMFKVYGGNTVCGETVSGYGLINGYLDYRALANIVGDLILNNDVWTATEPEDWELVSGEYCYGIDIDGNECDPFSDECYDISYYDAYQHYIISESGYNFLKEYTDEIVYYNNELNIYLWAITHYGTSWDYVLTNIKLVGHKNENKTEWKLGPIYRWALYI